MGTPAKTCQKTLEMHLAPQLIHLLLTEDFCNDLCGQYSKLDRNWSENG